MTRAFVQLELLHLCFHFRRVIYYLHTSHLHPSTIFLAQYHVCDLLGPHKFWLFSINHFSIASTCRVQVAAHISPLGLLATLLIVNAASEHRFMHDYAHLWSTHVNFLLLLSKTCVFIHLSILCMLVHPRLLALTLVIHYLKIKFPSV